MIYLLVNFPQELIGRVMSAVTNTVGHIHFIINFLCNFLDSSREKNIFETIVMKIPIAVTFVFKELRARIDFSIRKDLSDKRSTNTLFINTIAVLREVIPTNDHFKVTIT